MSEPDPASSQPIRPRELQVHVLRQPIATPVRTSFGTMRDRPALLLRVEDVDGAHGWGEVWCNFPACGAEHRAQLVNTVLWPLWQGQTFDTPQTAFDSLTSSTAVLALQSGEHGPLAQCIAGLDLALWDLCARRAGQPLWRWLGGRSDTVGVYASGINPDRPQDVVAARRAEGHRAFKLKLGFGAGRDLANLQAVRDAAGPAATLMADANQAWALSTALAMAPQLEPFGLTWLEEPLRADRPASEWQALRDHCGVPLAAGENCIGEAAFAELIATRAVRVVQPDVAKWGGISGSLRVIGRIHEAGLRYCPHFLGAGVGLLHSAHLLAAVGGDGLLEVDANDNPLRTRLCGPVADVRDGIVTLGTAAGIGIEPDLSFWRPA